MSLYLYLYENFPKYTEKRNKVFTHLIKMYFILHLYMYFPIYCRGPSYTTLRFTYYVW